MYVWNIVPLVGSHGGSRGGSDRKYRGGIADTHGSVNYPGSDTIIKIITIFTFSGSQKASDVQPRSFVPLLRLRFKFQSVE